MKIPTNIVDSVKALDSGEFARTRDQWIRPSVDLTGLRLLHEKAIRERDLRELYRGRAAYELLQNADDVHAKRATFFLTPEGTAFAHDGNWFTVANFRSLADGWSDKDPNQCIGHKGLGFRSVLDITPAPHVFRVGPSGFFGFKFTWALNNGHIQEVFRHHPDLKEEYQRWTRNGQSACPVMAIPGEAKKASLGSITRLYDQVAAGAFGHGYTTMFWFPANDPDADKKVLGDLDVTPIVADAPGKRLLLAFLEKDVAVLLPFLSNINEVAVYDGASLLGKASIHGNRELPIGDKIRVSLSGVTGSYTADFFQAHFSAPIPSDIRNDPETPKAVRQMSQAEFRLSVRLKNNQPCLDDTSSFHVYFPTEERTGLGVVVHGDFYVKPDRTRLMPGKYNQWLIKEAARRYSREFLTSLLSKYAPRMVFEAIQPVGAPATEASKTLVTACSEALARRTDPFVPTVGGLLSRQEVLVPPSPDRHGFWLSHFSDVIADVMSGKRAFLNPADDSPGARSFLEYAGVEILPAKRLLDFMEVAGRSRKSASWWFQCYEYMADDAEVARWGHPVFAGRALIPDNDLAPVAVPGDASRTVCLPPSEQATALKVPKCFLQTFVFLNAELARTLREGRDEVRAWLLNAFGIARFEATDLVPRAIRATVKELFDETIPITASDLTELWLFLRKIISLSRGILSTEFWQDVGRLPVPVKLAASTDAVLTRETFAPAFLAYWPDTILKEDSCLVGVPGLRRIAQEFVDLIVKDDASTRDDWFSFFGRAGVSASPKALRYARVVGAAGELPIATGSASQPHLLLFTGDKQRDENQVVVENLWADGIWDTFVEGIEAAHGALTLHSLALIDAFGPCVRQALKEYQDGNPAWRQRLIALVRGLPIDSVRNHERDQGFRRAARGGGSPESVGSYLNVLLDHYPWLPSSCGPRTSRECFARMTSRRLISRSPAGDELGDILIPYIVAETLEEYARLDRLGVDPLDDAGAARPTALVRALRVLGDRLSTESGETEVLRVRSRWRFVRGAIQEIYRVLNQTVDRIDVPADIRLASRVRGDVAFCIRPVFYADPGSPIEQAFRGVLPLFDADRTYQKLFADFDVKRLVAGQSVEESFAGEDRAAPASRLRDEILADLGPYLLAVIIAKSDEQHHKERVLRRLRERFEVRVADRLVVTFRYTDTTVIEQSIDFPQFYLKRSIVDTLGAIKETHYTLYVAGRDDVSLFELDGDALGDAIAPVWFDGSAGDLPTLFPRIVSRFREVRGNADAMRAFLYQHLGISVEAQEMASDDVAGKADDVPPLSVSPPPTPRIVLPPTDNQPNAQTDIQRHLQEHERTIKQGVDAILRGFSPGPAETLPGQRPEFIEGSPRRVPITREQEARGRRGEEEYLRRIKLPGGWEGFFFLEDRRSENCGYDFLCLYGSRRVKVEVKTFARDGRVIVSDGELKEAAKSGDDYYLLGLLDEGSAEKWESVILRNPVAKLLEKGRFQVDAKLEVPAREIMDSF